MASSTAAPDFKQAMVAAAHTLWDETDPDVQIAFGHPGKTQADDIVAFGRLTSEQEPSAMAPTRPRTERLTLDVVFSVYRAGGPEMEQVASDRAYALLGQLEEHVRLTDTTLGGTVQFCFLTAHESTGSTDEQTLSRGRLIETTAVFTAQARIR